MSEDQCAAIAVDFASAVYSLEACKRAAYAFMAKADVVVGITGDTISCTLTPLGGRPVEALVAEFQREVLDQDLRISTEVRTEPMRNLILGLAFSKVAQAGG